MAQVAVVIPAYNATSTIAATIRSVRDQIMADVEIIVIDDGSTDDTGVIASNAIAGDQRFRIVRQANGGLAAARNRGIETTTAPYLLFLDADDTIAPTHLRNLLDATNGDGDIVGYTGYQRLLADGTMLAPTFEPAIEAAPFEAFAHSNKVAVHSVLVPRHMIAEVGLFDPSLAACEDWDLWQRIARKGARFIGVEEPTAFYLTHFGSMSRNFAALAASGVEVLARCRRPDPRVGSCDDRYADGYAGDQATAAAHFILWCFTAAAATGDGLNPDFPSLPDADFGGCADGVASNLYDALMIGGQVQVGKLAWIWNRARAPIAAALEDIEGRSSEAGLAHRVIYALERRLIREDLLETPMRLSLVSGQRVSLKDLAAIDSDTDLLHLRIWGDSDEIIRLELPGWGGFSARDLASLIEHEADHDRLLACLPVRSFGFSDARRVFEDLTKPDRAARNQHVVSAWIRKQSSLLSGCSSARNMAAIKAKVAAVVTESRPLPMSDEHPGSYPLGDYSKAYWEAFFDRENPWELDDPFEQRKYDFALSLLEGIPVGRALEVGCAEGHFTLLLAPRVEQLLAVDISVKALERVLKRCAGLPQVAVLQVDLAKDPLPTGFDLTICSETLYYLNDKQRLKQAACALRDTLVDGGLLLSAHSLTVQDDPGRTGFDWGMAFGADSIAETFDSIGGLVLERSLRSDLYRIDLWRRTVATTVPPLVKVVSAGLPRPAIHRTIRWGGVVHRAEDLCRTVTTRSIPILMYHMIGDEGPETLARYRTTAAAFEEQLRLLRRHGFYAITSPEFDWYRVRSQAIPGRAVMLTFDDGYRDFYEVAWPILYRNDFRADVFVVTGKVGGVSDWDIRYGAAKPLMDWGQIAELHQRGVAFGSHLVSHRHVDSLSTEMLADEAIRSRLTIERRVGWEARAIASPSGGIDERAIRIFHEAGYTLCYSTREGVATIDEHSLNLPRIEVYGGMHIDDFAAAVGLS